MMKILLILLTTFFFRLPRAQADGKGPAVEEKAGAEKLGPENNPLGSRINTSSQGLGFVGILEVTGSTRPTTNIKIPPRC